MKKTIGIVCVLSCFMMYSNISATSVGSPSTQQLTKTNKFSAEERKKSLKERIAAGMHKMKEKSGALAMRTIGYSKGKNAATVSNTKVMVGTQQALGGEQSTNNLIMIANLTEAISKDVNNLSALNDKASARLMSLIENANANPIDRQNAIIIYTFLKMMRAYLPTLVVPMKNTHELLVAILTSKKVDKKFITKRDELRNTLGQILNPEGVYYNMFNMVRDNIEEDNIRIRDTASKAEMEKMLLYFGKNTAILGSLTNELDTNAVNLFLAVKAVLESPITAESTHINIIRSAFVLDNFAIIAMIMGYFKLILEIILDKEATGTNAAPLSKYFREKLPDYQE